NFFKLRDLMEAIDVFVGYDNATKAITLDTSKGYVPEGSAAPAPTPTTPAPTPTTPPTTPPPSGGLNAEEQELVGTWQGAFRGFSMYYEFRADGTYSFVLQQHNSLLLALWSDGNFGVWVGNWSRTGNDVYLSQNRRTEWTGRYDCFESWATIGTERVRINSCDELPWFDAVDDVMHIEMCEPNEWHLNRYFKNYSIVDDGLSPSLENSPLPDWLYLGV
ncbi:MAG: hypothetical protein FWG48_02805, partial [Oscillospiraceae bacterium]|nr:hypothetical protein [Oscillospiraceae bacterium]